MENDILQALIDSYRFLFPEMALVAGACVLFLMGTFAVNRHITAGVAFAIVVLAGVLHCMSLPQQLPDVSVAAGRAAVFNAPIWPDGFAALIRIISLAGGLVLILFSWNEVSQRQGAEFFGCLLVILAGLSLTGAANDLIVLFLALELISIPTYILLYLPKHDLASQEAALKYFLLSVFSSALTLFGFSYLYGLAGTTNLATLFDTLQRNDVRDVPALAHVAVIMVVAGLGFRIAAVPFHFYAPDVYQGAPTVGAALVAFIPKVAGFAALLRVLGFIVPAGTEGYGSGLPGMALSTQVPTILWFVAAVTMTLGNFLALLQDNLKRLLAYSSVAHAGYMLVGLAVAPYLREAGGVEAILYYLVAYGAMTIGAFAVLAYLDSSKTPIDTVDDLAGLSKSHPAVALVMTVFMFSLVGIPLTAGFTGKLLVFFGAMSVPATGPLQQARVLAIIGMLNAAIGGWYYLRIVAAMYLRNPLRAPAQRRNLPVVLTLAICVVLTIGLSVPPGAQWLMAAAREAVGK